MGHLFPLIANKYQQLFIWCHNDVSMSESQKSEFYGFCRKGLIFQIFAKNPKNTQFHVLFFCLFFVFCFCFCVCFFLIINDNDCYNIHKFQVHSTNIFGLRAKTSITRWQPPPPLSLTAYHTLPLHHKVEWIFFFFLVKWLQRMIPQLQPFWW